MNTLAGRSSRAREPRVAWLGWGFFSCLLLITALGKLFKDTGAIGLLVVLLVSLAYGAREFTNRRNLFLSVFALVGAAYIAVSYAHLLPGAWTLYWDRVWILQQAAFVLGLPIIVAASQRWWRDPAFSAHRFKLMGLLAIAFLIIGPVIDFITKSESVIRPMLGLRNDWMLGIFAFLYLGVFARGRVRIISWIVLCGILAASAIQIFFIQTLGCVAFLILCLALAQFRIPLSRPALIISVLTLFVVTVIGFFYLTETYELDKNTGIRLVFWIDGMRAVQQTSGLGVGFGTEALRNEYHYVLPFYREFLSTDDQQFALVGMHNAFFDIVFRMGFIGLFMLLYLLYSAFPIRRLNAKTSAVASGAFWLVFICLYFNMALQSPMHLIAVGFILGFLRYLNQMAQRMPKRETHQKQAKGFVRTPLRYA